MSTSYHVFCVDCGEQHDFDRDGSRHQELCRSLIEHRSTLAGLSLLMADAGGDLRLGSSYGFGDVDTGWFLTHATHVLKVRDEYGRIDGECGEHFKCPACSTQHRCKLPAGHPPHEGGH